MTDRFRRLMQVALAAGAAAGLLLFAIQWAVVTPLIRRAEVYERLEHPHAEHQHEAASAWTPDEGFERVAYTALGTILTGIGFSALLFGVASLLDLDLDARRGIGLGAAGCVCVALAPSLGLPPRPPGVAGPELHPAQLWWVLTVVLSSIGLWLLIARRGMARAVVAFLLVLPHLIGAPAAIAPTVVPRELIWRFAAASIVTQVVFWLALGLLGGWMIARADSEKRSPLTDGYRV